jgi:hypothetical protein
VHIGAEVDKINHWAAKVRALEKAIPAARTKILAGPRCDSYFVFFDSQKDAAIAAQVNIHPQDGNSFRIAEAPGPEEVCISPLSGISRLTLAFFSKELCAMCRYHSQRRCGFALFWPYQKYPYLLERESLLM